MLDGVGEACQINVDEQDKVVLPILTSDTTNPVTLLARRLVGPAAHRERL